MMWGGPMMGFGGSGGFGAIGMFIGFIFFAAIITGVVFLIVWLVKRSGSNVSEKAGTHSLEILKERYAKGELTKEQYENIRKDLNS